MAQYRVDLASMPWQAPAAGVRVKAVRQGGKQLRLVEFSREFVEPDWCTRGHVGYVLEGRLEVSFGGDVVVFGPGDGLLIPPGGAHRHKATALTDVVRLILVEDA
jgi:quercetin dioxygenase-like cupin family protein